MSIFTINPINFLKLPNAGKLHTGLLYILATGTLAMLVWSVVLLLPGAHVMEFRPYRFPAVAITLGMIVLVILPVILVPPPVQARFPDRQSLVKRVAVKIVVIYLLQSLALSLGFFLYEHFIPRFAPGDNAWYTSLAICFYFTSLLIIIKEGATAYLAWRNVIRETEQLKQNAATGQWLGLKSQVNPHFLFNSLNTLSSLITEDDELAEEFLNELSKVYRYMLRNLDDEWVPLEDELNFFRSYTYLLKTRYGNAFDVKLDIDPREYGSRIAPHALQTFFEYHFNNNSLSKSHPLLFRISIDDDRLKIEHNVQRKSGVTVNDLGIQNLVERYVLAGMPCIDMRDNGVTNVILIPLLISNNAHA